MKMMICGAAGLLSLALLAVSSSARELNGMPEQEKSCTCHAEGASCLFGTAGECEVVCYFGQGCDCKSGGCTLGFPRAARCKCTPGPMP